MKRRTEGSKTRGRTSRGHTDCASKPAARSSSATHMSKALAKLPDCGAPPIPHRHREKLLQQGYFQKRLAGIGPVGPTQLLQVPCASQYSTMASSNF